MPSSGMITPPSTPFMELLQENQEHSSSVLPSPNLSSKRPTTKPSISTRSISIKENVQVMVRCRPRSEKEIENEKEACWNVRAQAGAIQLLKPKSISSQRTTFYFDNVLEGVGNAQVYNASIQDLVRSAMMGYNGTVFAYGQTASGKTYTMMGTEQEPGVIPRSIQDVFSYIEEDTYGREYLLRVSYMEIYNEHIKDLLNVENMNPEIVEDKKGVYVRNLKEKVVKTSREVMDCIKEGERNRHISATDYNEGSSRSHTIFQLIIESRSKGIPSATNRGVRVSQLNLIDLAGSEKVASSVERRKEGAYINKSLLTLGNVISKLTSDIPSNHVPFRESKLTRILQAALSGKARISVICTINPTLASRNESLNTLRFAQHAKLIKTSVKMTKIHDHSELQNYLKKIEELQSEMQEKNELEAETRERLNNLLSLILTSSKVQSPEEEEETASSIWSDDISSTDDLTDPITIHDVVARCERGFAAQIATHQREMNAMKQHLESMQDIVRVMDSVQKNQADTLAKRDAQINKLEKDLAIATAESLVVVAPPPPPPPAPPAPAPKSKSTTRQTLHRKNPVDASTNTPIEDPVFLQDFSFAVKIAAEQITAEDISGIPDSNESFNKEAFAEPAETEMEKPDPYVLEHDVPRDFSDITTDVAELCVVSPLPEESQQVEQVEEPEAEKEPEQALYSDYVPYSQSIIQPWLFSHSLFIKFIFFLILYYLLF